MWIDNEMVKLENIINTWSSKRLKLYKIDKLKKMMVIISELSCDCDACEMYKSTVERLIRGLETCELKEYKHLMHVIRRHLVDDHDYVSLKSQFSMVFVLVISMISLIASFVVNEWFVLGLIACVCGIIISVLIDTKHFSKELQL